MKGMEILLKSLGFDQAKLQEEISKAGAEYKRVITHFDAKLNRILENQNEILKRLPAVQEAPPLSLIEGGKRDA